MQTTWILSANASRARFYSQAQPSDSLEEIDDMVNSAARLRTSETETDKIGPTSATKSQHNTGAPVPNKSYEPHQTPVEHQVEIFARNIADYLLKAYQEGRFRKLNLVVSPQFLGELRKLLDPSLESVVSLEINKDLTQFSAQQLLDQIKAHQH
jgi:protein required for attachment to host cells